MKESLRAQFNAGWSPPDHKRFMRELTRRMGCDVDFTIAETPVFWPVDVRNRFSAAADDIVALLSDPAFVRSQECEIPERYRSPGRGALPNFAQIDFAVSRDQEGQFVPRLVELQGFPSLYGFQIQLADVWATELARRRDMPDAWRLFLSGKDRYQAFALLQRAIVGDHDPEEVVLLDLDPHHQKTYPDFAVTQRWWGVDPVAPHELKRDGKKLYRVKDGKTIRVRRFYHRIVLDELESTQTQMPFRFDEELDVEWAPHPEWWFLWSKQSMLHLDHPCVPTTTRLDHLQETPDDLSGYVLKPLYSFAGLGVNVDPTHADLAKVAGHPGWVLQEKVDYTPAFQSPHGDGVKVEVRMMFVRPDGDEKMTLLLNLVRLSRGKMMGVDFNRNLDWTGASVGIWPEDPPPA